MNEAVDGERKGRCVHVFVYTCCVQKSVSQQCLPPRNTAGMLIDSQIHIHMHVFSIQQFTVHNYVHVSNYVHVVVIDYTE